MAQAKSVEVGYVGIGYGHALLRSFYIPHDPVVTEVTGPSMTRQEFQDECDVNVLMSQYERTGVWPMRPNDTEPVYLDVTEAPDLMTALQVLKDAEAAFMTLPAKVRREFENNALAFLNFAQDPENLEQMRDWGLFPPAPPPDPTEGLVAGQPSSVAPPAPASGVSGSPAPAPPRAP